MKIFTSKAAQEQVEVLEAQLESTEQELSNSLEQVQNLEEQLKDSDQAKSDLNDQIETLTTERNELAERVTELAGELAALKVENLEISESTSQKARDMIASVGHDQVEVNNEDQEKSLYDQYLELKSKNPSEAHKFWKANKAQLISNS